MSFAPELALVTVGKKQHREYVKAGFCAVCVIVLVCINSLAFPIAGNSFTIKFLCIS